MTLIKKVVCAISGGVDSAVAALLVKNQGFCVHGVFMKNWDVTNETGECSVDRDREDAKYVCTRLNIPFTEVNFVKEYWNDVFSQMVDGYEKGTTPNPDVLCNRYVKFGALFNYAVNELNADALATGHYARNSAGQFLQHRSEQTGSRLLCGVDPIKDQTLFLAQMPQHALQRTMFPLGGFRKSEVKVMAKQAGLDRVAEKKESMGICFIGSRNFSNFIDDYIPPKKGHFIDIDTGLVVGSHHGTHYWTVGQRTNLPGLAKAFFVQSIDAHKQQIIVAAGTDHPALFTQSLSTSAPHWIHRSPLDGQIVKNAHSFSCQFKFQHIHPVIDCKVTVRQNDGLDVRLSHPLRAVTPGQYAVFYRHDECLGSAQITESGPTLWENGQSVPKDYYQNFLSPLT